MKRIDDLAVLIEEVTGHVPGVPALVSGSGGGSKKGGGGGASSAPDTLFSTATVRIIDMIGEGEIVGVVGGLKGIYLNDIPVQNEDGTFNFKGFSAEFRTGAPEQAYMEGYPDVQTPQNIGVKVNQPTPVSASVTEPSANRVRATVQIPALFLSKNDGSVAANNVSYRIEVKYNGGPWTNPLGDQTISGKTTSGYFRSHELPLPRNPSGQSHPWTVRMTRLSPDTDDFNNSQSKYTNQSDTFFYSLTTLIDAKFSYPNTAVVGITAQAASFGSSVPVRKYLVDGVTMSVPTNYDPVARTYSGVWDGTFKTAYTNNPAWVLYLLLQNDRFGLGEYVADGVIDKWSLYDIGRYCDQMVGDGKGGQEPRATFNGVIETQQEAFELLQLVAQVFRGMVYWSSGAVTASQDRPRDPVLLVNEANVVDGEFSYASSSYKARHTVAIVRFRNPDNLHKVDYEVVEDDDGIARYGYNPTRVDVLGCTSRGQARRAGRWILITELKQTQVLSYRAGLDHAVIRPGDVVAVLDPSVISLDDSAELGGRTEAGSSTVSLVLDRPVVLAPGSGYTVSVTMPDGSVADRPVATPAGTHTTLSLAQGLPAVPDAGATWIVAGPTKPRLFSVLSIHEDQPHTYAVSALQYEPGKFPSVDDGTPFEATPFTELGNKVDPPINLTVRESQYRELGLPRQALTLSWTPANPFNATGHYVTAIRPSGAVVNLPLTRSVSVDFLDADAGPWTFLVATAGLNGNVSLPAQITYDVLGWDGMSPTRVRNLRVLGGGAEFSGKSCTMTWENAIPQEVTPYVVTNVVSVYDISTNDLIHHEVLPPGVVQWTYDYEVNVNEGGPRRTFRVAVAARSAGGVDGPQTSLAVSNPAPAKVHPDLSATSEIIFVDIAHPGDADFMGFLIWVSKTPGFNPLTTPPTIDTANTLTSFRAENNVRYYIRAAAYDAFSKDPAGLNISDEQDIKATIAIFDPMGPPIPGKPVLTTGTDVALDGTVTAWVKATWAPSSGENFAGRYQFAAKEGTGTFIEFGTSDAKWEYHGLRPGTQITTRVRAMPASGFQPSGWSEEAVIVAGKNDTPPANPTNFAAAAAFETAFLTWTPSVDKDVDFVEVWRSDTNNLASAKLLGKASSVDTAFVDPTMGAGKTQYYWIRAVNSSGVVATAHAGPVTAVSAKLTAEQIGAIDAANLTGQITQTQISDRAISTVKLAAGAVDTASLAAGAVVADKIAANAVTAGKIAAGAVVADTIGAGAITAGKIATNAIQAHHISAGAISANSIQLGNSSYYLSAWMNGGDNSRIEGGFIATNSIVTNSLKIGSRQIQLVGTSFYMERDANGNINNVFAWTAGSILYQGDNGAAATVGIPASRVAIDAGYWYIWWQKGQAGLNITKDNWDAVYNNSELVLIATVSGLTGISVLVGATVIDGTRITTRSIQADQIAANAIQAIHIAANTITADKLVAGAITADKIGTGTIRVGVNIYVGSQFIIENPAQGPRLRITNAEANRNRIVLGELSGFSVGGDYGFMAFDDFGNNVAKFASTGNYINGAVIGSATIGTLQVADDSISRVRTDTRGGGSKYAGFSMDLGQGQGKVLIVAYKTGAPGAVYNVEGGYSNGAVRIYIDGNNVSSVPGAFAYFGASSNVSPMPTVVIWSAVCGSGVHSFECYDDGNMGNGAMVLSVISTTK